MIFNVHLILSFPIMLFVIRHHIDNLIHFPFLELLFIFLVDLFRLNLSNENSGGTDSPLDLLFFGVINFLLSCTAKNKHYI